MPVFLDLAEMERKRQDIAQKQQALERQVRQLEARLHKQVEIGAIAPSLEAFCQRLQPGLAQATFDQKRELVELLIDRVMVEDARQIAIPGSTETNLDQAQRVTAGVCPAQEDNPVTDLCRLEQNLFDAENRIGLEAGEIQATPWSIKWLKVTTQPLLARDENPELDSLEQARQDLWTVVQRERLSSSTMLD